MTYILMIYTVIACGPTFCKYDWRPIGEFHGNIGAKAICEVAAKELNLKANEYRCVQSR